MTTDAPFVLCTVQDGHRLLLSGQAVLRPGDQWLFSAETARSHAAQGFVAIDGPPPSTTPTGEAEHMGV